MLDYDFYPLQIQFWIWGVAVCAALVVASVLWWRWGRPLRQARFVIEEVDAYRLLTVMDSKRRISQVVKQAEAHAVDHLRSVQLGRLDAERKVGAAESDRFSGRAIYDIDDVA